MEMRLFYTGADKGRLSRLEYLRNYEISALFSWAPSGLSLLASLLLRRDVYWQHVIGNPFVGFIVVVLWFALLISGILMGLSAGIQRFHDIGLSGVNYFFGLTTTISPAQRQLLLLAP